MQRQVRAAEQQVRHPARILGDEWQRPRAARIRLGTEPLKEVVQNCGVYGATMPSRYNLREPATEACLEAP